VGGLFIPAFILAGWAVLDFWLIKETPELAGFPYLDTHDASSGHMHEEYSTMDLLKKVFCSPLMLLLGGVELTSGVLRNGIMQWYTIFAKQVPQVGAEWIGQNWGLLLCMFGIVGGFAGGLVSDKFFQSRRGPPAALFSAFMVMMASVMAMNLFAMPTLVGIASLLIVAAVTGVHSLMSGTAAADFGGRKATATCSGIVDGCVYRRQHHPVVRGGLSHRPEVLGPQLAVVAVISDSIRAGGRNHRLPPVERPAGGDAQVHRRARDEAGLNARRRGAGSWRPQVGGAMTGVGTDAFHRLIFIAHPILEEHTCRHEKFPADFGGFDRRGGARPLRLCREHD
jgi:hypothetical protein